MNEARFEELKKLAARGRTPALEDWKDITPAQAEELAAIHREKGGFILDDGRVAGDRYKK
jgi:hypothetical protein